MTLKRRTFSAVRWTAAAGVFRALLQIAQVAVLARLLSPADYGLMAMVSVVLGFGGLFADLGVNSAFVQRREVTLGQRSSLFWLNVAVSSGIALLLVALSPLLSTFFGDGRLTPMLMLSASTFVLGALGQQLKMAAEKALHFRPVILTEVSAAIMGFVAAVLMALGGWGVYALVLSGIVSASAGTLLAWLFLADGWRPMWRLRLSDVRSFLGFGTALIVNNVANQINLTLDIFLGGKLLSAAALGLYSVPRNLALQVQFMVNPVITRVGFPLISQVQHDVARVRSIYLQTLNMTASTNAPVYVGMAFFAPEIVALMLGPGWERSGELLRILALWGGIRSTANPVGSLLLGMGRADLSMKWNLALLFLYPPALWFGSHFGPEGMAWTMLGLMMTFFIPGWYFLVRPLCKAGLVEYAIAALRPFVFSGIAIAPAHFLALQIDEPVLRLVLGIGIAAPLYLAVSHLGNREWFRAMLQLAGRRQVAES
ncbi:Colanic acid exporter [Methylococcus capsulatus]|uniref:Colanic acid exporter n=1 Tax=Methylococcus capsulatus TaxID=414 RepID=A0AA35UBW1_METCP|nr:MOP flippase family protein [Methylococcus capsulatus]CAI8723539.1 Colanic acid exporter [Methylococcus capsulatus]